MAEGQLSIRCLSLLPESECSVCPVHRRKNLISNVPDILLIFSVDQGEVDEAIILDFEGEELARYNPFIHHLSVLAHSPNPLTIRNNAVQRTGNNALKFAIEGNGSDVTIVGWTHDDMANITYTTKHTPKGSGSTSSAREARLINVWGSLGLGFCLTMLFTASFIIFFP